jgi:hypothetical protein
MIAPSLAAGTVNTMVDGARTYEEGAFAVTVPPNLIPDLEQYLQNQFQALVADGRAALVTNLGTAPPIYSLPQLQTDLALFGLARTLRSPLLALLRPPTIEWLSEISGRVVSLGLLALGPLPVHAMQQNCPVTAQGFVVQEGGCSPGNDSVGPPAIPFPPECDPANILKQLSTATGTLSFFADRPDCKLTPDHCLALPGHQRSAVRALPTTRSSSPRTVARSRPS